MREAARAFFAGSWRSCSSSWSRWRPRPVPGNDYVASRGCFEGEATTTARGGHLRRRDRSKQLQMRLSRNSGQIVPLTDSLRGVPPKWLIQAERGADAEHPESVLPNP